MFRLPIKHCLKSFSQHLQEAGSTYQLKTTPSTPPYLLSVLKTCYQLSTEIGDMHKVFLTWLITVTSPSPRQAQAELETRNNINAFIGTLMRRNSINLACVSQGHSVSRAMGTCPAAHRQAARPLFKCQGTSPAQPQLPILSEQHHFEWDPC